MLLFGGLGALAMVPILTALLKSLGHESAFFWYVSGMMVIAFLVSWRLPRQASYLRRDH